MGTNILFSHVSLYLFDAITLKQELIAKRQAYANNKNIYSLLMQYAAGFGKSNIIGWTALQLKDLRRNGEYVYDKIMIVVDRLQLRGQIDSKMLNMNIDNRMYVEAYNKKTFQEALKSDTRLVIVNLQKFGAVREMLAGDVLEKLSKLRIVFLIDEIHRSNSGDQHEEMVSIFDELQTPFDEYYDFRPPNPPSLGGKKKKNLIIGFTATPDDHTLARFGEFSGYAESEKLWIPFDSYTMREAIEDGYILNPLKNIVPVASKMLFDLPSNQLEGFVEPEYKDVEKKQIYENRDRINAIAGYVADLLVKDVYRQIRGTGKAMLAVYSINAAIAYKEAVTRHFNRLVQQPKYAKYAEAPIYIVYSSNQDNQKATGLNEGLSEEKVLENFALKKNGLIIVVAKLQTGFDEKKLHNRIEYVITLDPKYSDRSFLAWGRKFNTLYNMMHRSDDLKDAIEVYFDNQIGIIEVETQEPETKKKKTTLVAEEKEPNRNHQFDILAIIETRNEQEVIVGTLIEEFEAKISDFFDYVRNSPQGDRLIVKIKSHVAEDEIYDEFAKIYRKYKILNRNRVGNHFFKETEDLVNKLCDDFEATVR